MVGGELQMENCGGLRTENDSCWLQGRTTVVGGELQTDNESGFKSEWWASDGER